MLRECVQYHSAHKKAASPSNAAPTTPVPTCTPRPATSPLACATALLLAALALLFCALVALFAPLCTLDNALAAEELKELRAALALEGAVTAAEESED
jgi:hypothetical protein